MNMCVGLSVRWRLLVLVCDIVYCFRNLGYIKSSLLETRLLSNICSVASVLLCHGYLSNVIEGNWCCPSLVFQGTLWMLQFSKGGRLTFRLCQAINLRKLVTIVLLFWFQRQK